MDLPFDETTTPGKATLQPDLIEAIARLKGRAPAQAVAVPVDDVLPIAAATAQTVQREKATEERKADAAIQDKIGQQMGDKGIFIGRIKILGITFNAYAAPQDLTNSDLKYSDAQKQLAAQSNWKGHDGTDYKTADDLAAAIQDGSYINSGGGWFIPSRTLLTGTAAGSEDVVLPNNLLSCAAKGKLAGASMNSKYLSSSFNQQKPDFVTVVQLAKGLVSDEHQAIVKGRCRPMRLELAS